MIASFSRAVIEERRSSMGDAAFGAALAHAIDVCSALMTVVPCRLAAALLQTFGHMRRLSNCY